MAIVKGHEMLTSASEYRSGEGEPVAKKLHNKGSTDAGKGMNPEKRSTSGLYSPGRERGRVGPKTTF